MTNDNGQVLTGYTSSIGAFIKTLKMPYYENERVTYELWFVYILLTAWYYEGGRIKYQPLLINKQIEKQEEIEKYLNLPLKNTVIKLKMAALEDPKQKSIWFTEILEYNCDDKKLNNYLIRINKTEPYSYENAGLFLFDSGIGKFTNHILWNKDVIKLEIDTRDKAEAKIICNNYLHLFHDEKKWDKLIKEYVCGQMLDKEIYKPKSKMNPDRSDWPWISRKLDLLARLSIISLSINKEGLCVFCLNDGNYFFGLRIYVTARFDETLINISVKQNK